MLNYTNILGVLAVTALAACGGGATGPGGSLGGNTAFSFSGNSNATAASAATASTGYAQSGTSGVAGNVTYDLQPVAFNYATSGSNTLVATTATFAANSTNGTLMLNGSTYNLTYNNSSLRYEGTSGGNSVSVLLYSNTHAWVAYIQSTDNNSFLLDGYAIMGANTDPANVPTSGTAVAYTGGMLGYANYNNNSYDTISGPITLTANFQNSTISGSGTFSDGNGNAVGSFTTPSTTIVGNTFETVPNITLTTPGSTIANAQLQGDFYGPAGEEIGGTFSATGNTVIGGMTIQGVLLRTRAKCT
ncbi:MAG: transferrin-binding protein-like solute binding protein [Planktomarina sp.]